MITEKLNRIFKICCESFEVSEDEIRSKSKHQEAVYCRKAYCFIIKHKFDVKNEIIGRNISRAGKDVHSILKSEPANGYYKATKGHIKAKMESRKRKFIALRR